MVNVSHLTKKYVDEIPFLHEAMGKKLINYGAVANMLHPRIEREMGEKVKQSAIIMALRRYEEGLMRKHESTQIAEVFREGTEINMTTSLCAITLRKSEKLFEVLKSTYDFIDYEKGDIMNMIHANYDVMIVVNEKYKDRIVKLLKQDILHVESDLCLVSFKFLESYVNTPGIFYISTKAIYWNNINLIQAISVNNELNFLVRKKDAMRTYAALEELLDRLKNSLKKKK